MLFSQPELAEFLSEHFECAWESLRPAPHVRIDFGDGQVLERTLGGNVLTWFCLPDGRAYDVQPGVMTAEGYRGAAQHSLELFDELTGAPESAYELKAAAIAHREAEGWVEYVQRAVGQPMFSGRKAPRLDLSALTAMPSPLPATPGFTGFASKVMLEQPIVVALGTFPSTDSSEAPRPTPLEEDTVRARLMFRPQALGVLGVRPLSRPAELTSAVYRAILGIDPEDPYLGLAPALLGRNDGFTEVEK